MKGRLSLLERGREKGGTGTGVLSGFLVVVKVFYKFKVILKWGCMGTGVGQQTEPV